MSGWEGNRRSGGLRDISTYRGVGAQWPLTQRRAPRLCYSMEYGVIVEGVNDGVINPFYSQVHRMLPNQLCALCYDKFTADLELSAAL